MKTETYIFAHDIAKARALSNMAQTPTDGTIEWVKRDVKASKTMRQLGALFGRWIKYLSEKTGKSEQALHEELKAMFLARIYITDPQNDAQEQWVELCAIYQEQGETEKLERHAKRISLSWSSVGQTMDYMSAIEHHYMDCGIPLPYLDRFRRTA